MKKFCSWFLGIVGFLVIALSVVSFFYARHKGYNNAIDWLKSTEIFQDDNTNQSEEEIKVENEDGTVEATVTTE